MFLVFVAHTRVMDNDLISTGRAASLLGCSRQHVVDLCDSGRLPSVRIGTHRRVPVSAVEALTRASSESTAARLLHVAVAGRLITDPDTVLAIARRNIASAQSTHRSDGLTAQHLREWEGLLDAGLPSLLRALLSEGDRFVTLRSSSPFAGVLTDDERRAVLSSARAVRSA